MSKAKQTIFYDNIMRALDWLFETQDDDNYGWSWIRDVSPNSQNTAEVVNACAQFVDFLAPNQKNFVSEAVREWLLDPEITGAIVIDYAWILRALTSYGLAYDKFLPEFSKESVDIASAKCVDLLLYAQNEDGGWGESKGEVSTTIRTALVTYCISEFTKIFGSTKKTTAAYRAAFRWLSDRQNKDGGWGNLSPKNVAAEFRGKENDFSYDTISKQYRSNTAVTGYALMALGSVSPHDFATSIDQGILYLKKHQNSSGGYDMFYEVGMRGDVRFTFRHFGTVWALKGLMIQKRFESNDYTIVKGVSYLLSLQDEVSGAWKCSKESDVYTWSTCNALSVLQSVLELENGILESQYRTLWNRLLYEHLKHPEKAKNKKHRKSASSNIRDIALLFVAVCVGVHVLNDIFRKD